MAEQSPTQGNIVQQTNPEQSQASGSRKKRMAQRKKTPIQKPELEAFDDHNILAFLDETSENGRKLAGVITFLKRSRISKAISTPCTPYLEHIREFWKNVKYDSRVDRWLMTSEVYGQKIMVTPKILREVLGFDGEKEDSVYHLNVIKVKGIFKRCHYVFAVNDKGTLKTNGLPPSYRYLAYVLNLCLSPKKAGHDAMTDNIQCAFAALVLNADFSFSKMTFDHMVDNIISERNQWLKYPRFLQMVINKQAPELPKGELNEIVLSRMTDMTIGKMFVYRSDTGGNLNKPKSKGLICALKNSNYVCPGDRLWRNEKSDSEEEDLGLKPVIVESDEEVVETDVVRTGAVEAQTGEAGGSSVPGEAEVPKRKKSKGKRKVDDDEEEEKLMDIEDFLKENRKKTFKKVKITGGTAVGSGPTESNIRQSPNTSNPNQQQNLQQPINPSGSLITTTAGGVSVDVGGLQVDMRMMKESYIELIHKQKKFECDMLNHLKSLGAALKEESKQRQAMVAENVKLKERVEVLEADNVGLKKYSQMLMGKIEKQDKKLRITEGEEGDADNEDDESGDESEDAEDVETTQSEG